MYIYIYIYMLYIRTPTYINACIRIHTRLHPVRNPRFVLFQTQPLESLSAAVKLSFNKKVSGQPNPWNTSW